MVGFQHYKSSIIFLGYSITEKCEQMEVVSFAYQSALLSFPSLHASFSVFNVTCIIVIVMYTIYTTFKERRITSSVTKACHYLALRVQQRNSTLRVAGLSATSQLMLPHCCVCQVREELVHVRRANVSINCNCGIICNVSLFLSFLL